MLKKMSNSRDLDIGLSYIENACIVYSNIHDFITKTLIIDFKDSLSVVSTLEGQREGIKTIGNHYSPSPFWNTYKKLGLKDVRAWIYQTIDKSEETASFLFTGADVDNLSIKQFRYKDIEIYALISADIKSNAIRMSKDTGDYYEPGTINIILLPNVKLTHRAMTRAIISATEAKTAALLDMDIRSSYTSRFHGATGTGTDNIIVAQGDGIQIDMTGGHTKMGELVAKAEYEGVKEAVYKQNNIIAERNVFQRLKERKINMLELISKENNECSKNKNDLVDAVEKILLDSRYAGFVQSSFAVSDEYEKGLFTDLAAYELWCEKIVEEIAGREIAGKIDLIAMDNLPVVLRMALNSILSGAYYRSR